MRNEDDHRWQNRWPEIKVPTGTEQVIIEADGPTLLRVMIAMNLLHMNDATRAMLRDKYPETYTRLLEAQYADAEQRLLVLLRKWP